MADACARRRRSPESVRLLAATKTVEAARIRAAYEAGCRLLGENRVQERQEKREALSDLAGAEWHLLGPLQQNKAGRAVAMFDCIETVESLALARRLDRLAGEAGVKPAVLLEINMGREPQKHGAMPESALELAGAISGLDHVELRGVMTVPPYSDDAEDARRYFAELAELGERIRTAAGRAADGWELSMGMSHDYTIAIEEGATLVRLGTALFGSRPGSAH